MAETLKKRTHPDRIATVVVATLSATKFPK
jgi:hypothetical protein